MLTKNQLFQFLFRELESEGVDDAEELADRIAERADEEGLFEVEEED
jgi:hypothetical protein